MNSLGFNLHLLLGQDLLQCVCARTNVPSTHLFRECLTGGHFSGNMGTFLFCVTVPCRPIVWSWQGAPRKHVGSYIKFAIPTSTLVSSGAKGSTAEWERDGENREEISKDDCVLLMGSKALVRRWRRGQPQWRLALGWKYRAGVKVPADNQARITCSFPDHWGQRLIVSTSL